ncbi:MAG TPA: uracil permease [Clostridiales bacterium]|nr:uracil permease [Clostridiales bacterium]
MTERKIVQVDERLPFLKMLPLSIQHVFAMFGASVLVPLIFGIDTGVVLLMNGVGTLLFIWITKGRAPAYLGSSFAFIAPVTTVMAAKGVEYAQGGVVLVGAIGMIVAFIIYKFGTDWIDILLPPAAMGPIVALIGFELAGVSVGGGAIGATLTGEGATVGNIVVFAVTLLVAVFGSVLFRGFLGVIPLLIALICGYITAIFFGMVDFTPLMNTKLFTIPHFVMAKFDLASVLTIAPVALVLAAEHIGHQIVTSEIVGRDLLKDPGLHRSYFADNFSTALSGLFGAVGTTTYGENIGVMAVTGVYSVQVIGGAAVISILMAFIGPLSALISTIPGDVIGGLTFLLYGMIGTSGLRILVDRKVDYAKSRNLVMTSVVFVTGLSGLSIQIGEVSITGMALSAIVGLIFGLVFFVFDKLGVSTT